jgi:hypothetical protein
MDSGRYVGCGMWDVGGVAGRPAGSKSGRGQVYHAYYSCIVPRYVGYLTTGSRTSQLLSISSTELLLHF